jgi:hypothetical protein
LVAIAASAALPPAFQDLDAGLNRERLGRAHHAVAGVDHGARGLAPAGRGLHRIEHGVESHEEQKRGKRREPTGSTEHGGTSPFTMAIAAEPRRNRRAVPED